MKVEGKQLANVIAVWLRDLPSSTWGKDPDYERLRAQKRHDPELEPDQRAIIAAFIAHRIEELGWQVSYPERENIFADQVPKG